jgi:hypothetical protein
MIILADNNDDRGIIVLRKGEVVDVVSLDNTVAILVANLLVAIVVDRFRVKMMLRSIRRYLTCRRFSSIEAVLSAFADLLPI